MSGLTKIYNNVVGTLSVRRFDVYGGMVSGYPYEVEVPGNFSQFDQIVRMATGEEVLAMGYFDFDEKAVSGEELNTEDQITINGRRYAIFMVQKHDLRGSINRTRLFLR